MDKKYSKKEIINALDNSKFESRYKCYDTYLEQNEKGGSMDLDINMKKV